MHTIYKYRLKIADTQQIQMPEYAEVIHMGLDPLGDPCLWARVNPEYPAALVDIFVVGTGCNVPERAKIYLGSIKQDQFMWHIFRSPFPFTDERIKMIMGRIPTLDAT
jgi:hypothetical protein